VYVFSGTTYVEYTDVTDASGTVTFTLPMGDYRFRADKNGTWFWSDENNPCMIPGCTAATVTTTVPVTVLVIDGQSNPEAGLPVHVFDETTYTGYGGTTDPAGQVTFTLPMGDYWFRADKDGTEFWSASENHCTIPGCATAVITTTTPGVTVVVRDSEGTPESGLPVYVYDGETNTGYAGTTNVSGTVAFLLPAGTYRFRADKNGTQFWSGESNHCSIPGCATATVTTTIPVVVSVENTNGTPEAGLSVYVFDGTTSTGRSGTTDVSGQVTFTLPMGDYRFRADREGTEFWSGASNHCSIPGCTTATVTTTVPVVVSVSDTDGDPEASLPVYVYSGTTYTGHSGTTTASGQVTFTLPMGDYRFRADKNGTQFWSAESNHCTLPGCTTATVTTTIPVVVAVKDTNGTSEAGLPGDSAAIRGG
jgi:ribosomal protein S11